MQSSQWSQQDLLLEDKIKIITKHAQKWKKSDVKMWLTSLPCSIFALAGKVKGSHQLVTMCQKVASKWYQKVLQDGAQMSPNIQKTYRSKIYLASIAV